MPCLLAVLVLAAPVQRVVVLDMAGKGEAASLAEELTELLASTIRETSPDTAVLGQSEIKAVLSLEQQRAQIGCEDDTACLAEIGGALGADHLVTSRLGRVGSSYLVSLKLIEAKTGAVVRQFSDRVAGSDEKLIDSITRGARQLFADPHQVSPLTAPEPVPAVEAESETPFGHWWVWAIAGGALLAGGGLIWALTRGSGQDHTPVAAGGAVRIDFGDL